LAGDEWFCDHIADLGSKDSRIELAGKWIIEISELAATRRAETEKVKAFLTARADHYRPPYGRRAVNIPRQNVFAASTNDEQPFVDSTGNRRYWPVRCGEIDVEAIHRDRDQIWAEAYLHFKAGKPWWLETPELNGLAREEQEERYEDGVWDNLILDWTENPRQREELEDGVPILPWYGSTNERVSVIDILIHAIGKSPERLTQIDKNQVVRCLTHHGWTKKQARGGPDRGKRYYVRPR
jgi:predicted P-loop ATPase